MQNLTKKLNARIYYKIAQTFPVVLLKDYSSNLTSHNVQVELQSVLTAVQSHLTKKCNYEVSNFHSINGSPLPLLFPPRITTCLCHFHQACKVET